MLLNISVASAGTYEKENNPNRRWIEKAIIVFTLALGINRFPGIIRNYYFDWLENA